MLVFSTKLTMMSMTGHLVHSHLLILLGLNRTTLETLMDCLLMLRVNVVKEKGYVSCSNCPGYCFTIYSTFSLPLYVYQSIDD